MGWDAGNVRCFCDGGCMSGLGGWAGGVSGGVRVVRAYRFALDPSAAQERALRSHAGAARFGWNWGLAKCQERYAAEGKWYSAAELHRLWNAQKKADPALGWWAQNSKCSYQEAFRDLDRALRDFTASRTGGRKGRRVGFPRFKKRGRCKDSFRFSGVMRCAGSTVTLPRLGTIGTQSPPASSPEGWRTAPAGSCRPRCRGRRLRKTRHRRAAASETGTRPRARGQDRDRRAARPGCQPPTHHSDLTGNGMTGWNCSDGDHVCIYVPGTTDTDGVIDDL